MLGVSKNDKSCGCLTDPRIKTCSRCSLLNDEDDDEIRTNCVLECMRTRRSWTKSVVFLLYMLNVASAHYTQQWAVHIQGGEEVANRIAAKHGFVNIGKIFDDLYHFHHKAVRKRSLEPDKEYHSNLIEEIEVIWAKQQKVKRRSKRDLIPRPRKSSDSVKFNDVRWPQMWYLNRGGGLDMNVQQAWQEGISGKGVVVTILDDGLEKNHPDLVKNYDPQASYDVNNHDEDPMPRYDLIDSNRHGTRCAGEVAAVANNSLCSVGVAFGASVGGVRMLDGDVTDAVEARSLSLNPQHIDIYSASWGPDDDGKTVDGPGELATRAFIEGVTKGRQGKGSIFVWASGNGGRDHDNCNCDGYTNSIWTLSISSATENGLVPWYSEACSSTLATTYSSGSSGEKQIVTTDLHHQCTSGHTGTSASAPLAAGICALALEANKDLTWRDMQHIVVRTARPANLKSPDWKVNGVGRNVSHSFGYGLMDASAMVRLARSWKTVPEQHRCEVSAPHVDKLIPARSKVILNLTVTECNGVNFLEHVQAKISLSSSRRGDLQIYLTSPAGTRSTLLAKRPQDSSRNPFNAWPFMSVHTWGEMPFGIWQLEIHNEGRFLGHFEGWQMLLYGTEDAPNGESISDNGLTKDISKNILSKDLNIEDDVPNHLDPEAPNRGFKDPRHDVQKAKTGVNGASSGCASFSKSTSQCIECMKGLYLYEDRCESVCPAKTYPGINVKERSACLPCHYTCLTCVGESDSQCTSCYDEAIAVPSDALYQVEDSKKLDLVNHTDDPGIFPLPKPKVTEDTLALDDDNAHWSYGKRETDLLVNRDIRKKAVTKKILENYNKPRPLYYCYPARVVEEINSSAWYYRMTVLFSLNFILLVSFLIYYLYAKCCIGKSSNYAHISDLKYKYSKMKNGDSNVIKPGSAADNIIYISTSEEE